MNPKQNLSSHILPTSAAMLGVCMTVISIVKLNQLNHGINSWIDEILAIDALFFLLSSILSYISLRNDNIAIEDWADKVFIFAISLMGLAVVVLTYELV